MINLKYIREAHRLRPIALEDAKSYSQWQEALYCTQLELEERAKEREQHKDADQQAAA